MKLIELNTEATWDGDISITVINEIEYSITMETIEEGIKQFNLQTKASPIEKIVGGTKELIKKHPVVSTMAALWAANAVSKYYKNKKYTTRFFAKTYEDRKLYDRIIKDLMASGHYKLVKSKYVDGGYMWELQRKSY